MANDELLDRDVKENAESAFTAIVTRHLNLVYSTALRHVRSPHLAEEVTQSVFIDLSRQMGRIRSGTSLVAWLHVVARRTAVDAIRRESRRRANESSAALFTRSDADVVENDPPWIEMSPTFSARPTTPRKSGSVERWIAFASICHAEVCG